MLRYLLCFWVIVIINEEAWENLMDAILLTPLPSPQKEPKAILSTESEAERETPNVGKDLAATKKHLNQNTVLPSSNVLAETCEDPTLDFHLPQGTFIHQAYLWDLCGSDVERNVFLTMSYFITQGMQPWKKHVTTTKSNLCR